jgi:uncharacterized membrane protein YkoI
LTTPLSQSHHDNPLIGPVSKLSFSKRDDMFMIRIVVSLLLLWPLAGARADDDHRNDHGERAGLNAAINRGEVMALADILSKVTPQLDGRILEIEFEIDDGVPVYEFYVLRKDGRRLEYEVDARTAEILGFEDDD